MDWINVLNLTLNYTICCTDVVKKLNFKNILNFEIIVGKLIAIFRDDNELL